MRQAIDGLLASHDPQVVPEEEFWEAQYDAGLAWVHFPEGSGGLGLSPGLQQVIDQALEAAGSTRNNIVRNIIAIGMAGPTIVAHGTEEQKARYLRPMFATREYCCAAPRGVPKPSPSQ